MEVEVGQWPRVWRTGLKQRLGDVVVADFGADGWEAWDVDVVVVLVVVEKREMDVPVRPVKFDIEVPTTVVSGVPKIDDGKLNT